MVVLQHEVPSTCMHPKFWRWVLRQPRQYIQPVPNLTLTMGILQTRQLLHVVKNKNFNSNSEKTSLQSRLKTLYKLN